MFEKKNTYNRFDVKKVGEKNPIETYILTDKEAGVQYLYNCGGAGSGSGSSGNGGNGSDGDPNIDDDDNVKKTIIPPIEDGDDIGNNLTSGEQSYDKDDVIIDDSTSVDDINNNYDNISNKPSKNEINFEGIIKDLASTGIDVSLEDKATSSIITSSSSSLNSSRENSNKEYSVNDNIETSNIEDYSKDNTYKENSIDSSSMNDKLSEESSHKGLLATVVSTIGVTLGAIFVWIRKLFGFVK